MLKTKYNELFTKKLKKYDRLCKQRLEICFPEFNQMGCLDWWHYSFPGFYNSNSIFLLALGNVIHTVISITASLYYYNAIISYLVDLQQAVFFFPSIKYKK